jgi:RimK family alpha-L-glutamate ligase
MKRVAIFGDQPEWHARRLAAAFAAEGAATVLCSLRSCAFELGGSGPGILIPGFDGELPDAVLVRGIAAGSFEQVTLRLGFLHALARLGVPVVNDARAIERCVDKSMTSFLLHRAGIATPETLVTEDPALARRHLAQAAEDLVQKPLFGSQGRGLARLAPRSDPPAPAASAGVYYLQRFVGRDEAWRDYRVMVVGGAPVAAMLRRGRGWITNVHQGGRCEAAPLTRPLAELSVGAAEAVGAAYAGIDLIEQRDGALLVLEVNSAPSWRGLQSVTDIDIAAAVARHVLDRRG